MRNKKGFTMVELLVVLVIVAILAAVATPIYLANVERSRASEAVSTMALIRQAQRDYRINANTYFDITSGNIDLPLPVPSTITAGVPNPVAGVDVDAGVAKYFSNTSFSIDSTVATQTGASTMFTLPTAVDFIITVDGNASAACTLATSDDCATNESEVADYELEMDNSGRTFVSYDNGANWAAY